MYVIYKKRNCGDDCLIAIIRSNPEEYIKDLHKIDRKYDDYVSNYSEYYATQGDTMIHEFDEPDMEVFRVSRAELEQSLIEKGTKAVLSRILS